MNGAIWVDILNIILMILVISHAKRHTLLTEGFQVFTVFFAVFIAMHYYYLVRERVFSVMTMPEPLYGVASFCSLIMLTIMVMIFVQNGWLQLLEKKDEKKEVGTKPVIFLGVIRAYMFVGILMFVMLLSGIGWVAGGVRNSYSGKYFVAGPVGFYEVSFKRFVKVLFPYEVINSEAVTIWNE